MHPKQGAKEPVEGESGRVKRDPRGTLRDQSGSEPVLLSECLHADPSPSNGSNKDSLTRTQRGRGTKLIPVTQESTGQDDRS